MRKLGIMLCLALAAGSVLARDLLTELYARRANAGGAVQFYPYNTTVYGNSYAWWTFDTSTNIQPDSAFIGGHPVDYRTGTPAWSNDYGGFLYFDGNDALAYNFPSEAVIPHTNGTIMGWVKFPSRAAEDAVIAFFGTVNSIYIDVLRTSLGGKMRILTATNNIAVGGNIRTDVWTHFALTGGTGDGAYKYYTNGILDTARTVYGGSDNGRWLSQLPAVSALAIGSAHPYGSEKPIGSFSDIAIFDKALTSNEIYTVYQDTKGTYGL